MKQFPLLFLVVVLTSFASAQTTVNGSGGSLAAPTVIGQSITVSNVTLTDGRVASLDCPVTFFGAGTYQWNWQCDGGTLSIDGTVVETSINGSMKLTCSGGGRAHPTVCYHIFTGSTAEGPVYVSSKGRANNAASAVVQFSATY